MFSFIKAVALGDLLLLCISLSVAAIKSLTQRSLGYSYITAQHFSSSHLHVLQHGFHRLASGPALLPDPLPLK